MTGKENIKVILAPWDFRKEPFTPNPNPEPIWINELYEEISREISAF